MNMYQSLEWNIDCSMLRTGPIADSAVSGSRNPSNGAQTLPSWKAIEMEGEVAGFAGKTAIVKTDWEKGQKSSGHTLCTLAACRVIPMPTPPPGVVRWKSSSGEWQRLVSALQLGSSWPLNTVGSAFCCLRQECIERVNEGDWSLSLEVSGLWKKRENSLCPIWFLKVRKASAQPRGR